MPTGSAAPENPPTEFRYGDDAPDYLRGKTAREAASLMDQTVMALRQLTAQQPAYQPPPQYQAPPQTQPGFQINPDDYVTGKALQDAGNVYAQMAAQQAQQYANPAIAMAASGNLDRVRERYKNEFAKYGPEIYGHLAQLPKTQWDIDSLEKVVKFTLVSHLDEIANERAGRLAASQEPALRSSGANGTSLPSSSPSPTDQLSPAQRDVLSRSGVSVKVVEDFCAKTGMPVSKWFERFGKSAMGDAA